MGIAYFISWCDKLGYHLSAKAVCGKYSNGYDSFRNNIFVPAVIYDSLQNRISHLIEWHSRIYCGWAPLIMLPTDI
jgi:hypothetical protein